DAAATITLAATRRLTSSRCASPRSFMAHVVRGAGDRRPTVGRMSLVPPECAAGSSASGAKTHQSGASARASEGVEHGLATQEATNICRRTVQDARDAVPAPAADVWRHDDG